MSPTFPDGDSNDAPPLALTTVTDLPDDTVFATQIATANAAGASSISAVLASQQQERDAAAFRAANGWA